MKVILINGFRINLLKFINFYKFIDLYFYLFYFDYLIFRFDCYLSFCVLYKMDFFMKKWEKYISIFCYIRIKVNEKLVLCDCDEKKGFICFIFISFFR